MSTSVKDIRVECERLLKIANEVPNRMDVYTASVNLKHEMESMLKAHDEDQYDEAKVARMKDSCESAAIILEYYLTKFDEALNVRYKNRTLIIELFNKVDNHFKKLSAGDMKESREELSMTLVARSVIKKLVIKTRHIKFELTESDKEDINGVESTLHTIGA